jgi:hypothetical protein
VEFLYLSSADAQAAKEWTGTCFSCSSTMCMATASVKSARIAQFHKIKKAFNSFTPSDIKEGEFTTTLFIIAKGGNNLNIYQRMNG